jgi:hypothetical protein
MPSVGSLGRWMHARLRSMDVRRPNNLNVKAVSVVVKDKDPFRTKERVGQVNDSGQLYPSNLTIPIRSLVIQLDKGH